jgi:MFS family permease
VSLRDPLGYPAFRWLALGRTADYLGTGMAPSALAFAVLDLTGSTGDLGLVLGARSAATVLLLLFGGVLADRLPRAVILQGTTALGALTQFAIAATVLTGVATVPLLAALSVLNGAATAAAIPAAAALTPQTVPAGVVRPANALARLGINLGLITGASGGGLIAALAGAGWAVAASGTAFLLAALAYAVLHRAPLVGRAGDAPPPGVLAGLAEGWREFTARPWVWLVVAQFMVVNAAITGGLQVVGPVIADATFGRTAWGFALAANAAGAMLGNLVAARWHPRRALLIPVALIGLDALPLLLLAAHPPVLLLGATLFGVGIAADQFSVAWEVALQQHIPADRLARVYSYDALGSLVAVPLGQLLIGPFAATAGPHTAALVSALLVLAATGAALASRSVRRLRATPAPGPVESVSAARRPR